MNAYKNTAGKIKLIAFDLDGTALHREKGLTDFTRRVLEKASERQVVLAPATGRAWTALPESLAAMDAVRYFITSNGSSVFKKTGSRDTAKRIYGRDMRKEQVLQMLNIAGDYSWPLEVFIEGQAYARQDYVMNPVGFGASSAVYVQSTRIPVKDIRRFVWENVDKIEGLNIVVADMAEKAEIRKRLEAMPDSYVTSSVPRYLEVGAGGICKASALAFLTEYLGITKEETAAFGDGENDIEMLKYAGIGIAMENAADQTKAAAKQIAGTCNEDGMAKMICRLLDL